MQKIVKGLKQDLQQAQEKEDVHKKGQKLFQRSLTFSQPKDGPHPALHADVGIPPAALDSWTPKFQSPRKKEDEIQEVEGFQVPEIDEPQNPAVTMTAQDEGDNFSIMRRGSALSMFEKVRTERRVFTNEPFYYTNSLLVPSAPQLKVNEMMSEIDISTAPKLLDSYARLQCSTVSGPMASPSDKIGSYFSIEGTSLCLDKNKGKIVWTKTRTKIEEAANEDVFGLKVLGLKQAEKGGEREEGEEKTSNSEQQQQQQPVEQKPLSAMGATRYLFYLNQGAVPEDKITPFDESLRMSLEEKFKDKDETKIQEFLAEVDALHLASVRKATLDYILLNEGERERLGIEQVREREAARSKHKNKNILNSNPPPPYLPHPLTGPVGHED